MREDPSERFIEIFKSGTSILVLSNECLFLWLDLLFKQVFAIKKVLNAF